MQGRVAKGMPELPGCLRKICIETDDDRSLKAYPHMTLWIKNMKMCAKESFGRLIEKLNSSHSLPGYDACLLVEHAGLKTMMDLSFSHNYPKVGFPCENLGQVVAHLTTIGFTMSENLKEMVPRKGMNEASVIYFYRIK
ncbi:unnamed protein product [Lactuca virosa]|uniref:Uncharacterized protein n=1 Tax=Lactuca virosa TaxID=75947 RepID=A0AAU9NUM1_9ASTR|nr:unnamed protein product [Lactuca virosa]